MSVISLVIDHCSGYRANGSCITIDIDATGNVVHKSREQCLVASNQPCKDFEELVLPKLHVMLNKKANKQIEKAIREYGEFTAIDRENPF